MMNGEDWRRLLTSATKEVQSKVSEVVGRGEVSKAVEVGASGDTTLVADKEAENELFRALTPIKGLRIISEEAGNWGDPRASLVAIVDPLDGSSNFERRIPFYCTSVAVAKGGSLKDISWALIRNLVTGDVYWAEKGKGSFKNGNRLSGSARATLREVVLDVDFSRGSPELVAKLARLVTSVNRQVHIGANALELCFLAEGAVDAFVDLRGRMRMTDFAAGYLIAREAGAEVTAENGSPLELPINLGTRMGFVASGNRLIHADVLELCR
jgi:myo-inositol-1(or 4)-monophosphatase